MPERNDDDPYKVRQYMEFNEDDPRYQVRILGMRVDALTKEKEHIERDLDDVREARDKLALRVTAIEASFGKGAGILIGLSAIGMIGGTLIAYGKAIFAPWVGK